MAKAGYPNTSGSNTGGGSPLSPVSPSEGLDLNITPLQDGIILETSVDVAFNWTSAVNEFGEGSPQIKTFEGDREITQRPQLAYLSHFDGNEGSRIYSARVNIPQGRRGSIEIKVVMNSGISTIDEAVMGPPSDRTLLIQFDTARQPLISIPELKIVGPPTSLATGRTFDLHFNWEEAVTNFTEEDIKAFDATDTSRETPSVVSFSNFRQNDVDGKEYSITVLVPDNSTETTLFVVREKAAQGKDARGPKAEETYTQRWNSTVPQSRSASGGNRLVATISKIPTQGYFAGVLEVKSHGDFVYAIIQVIPPRGSLPNEFPNTDVQAMAELWRIRKSNGNTQMLKTWNYVGAAGRSMCVHDGAVHLFIGSYHAYQASEKTATVVERNERTGYNERIETFNWKAGMGQVFRIDGRNLVEVGQAYRTAFVNPKSDRDNYYGIHGGTASPLVSNGDVLNMVVGYGDLRNITDIRDEVSHVDNWQWIERGSVINPRLRVVETNSKTAWQIIEDVARSFGLIAGFKNGNFFMRDRAAPSAQLTEDISATATITTLGSYSSLDIPLSGIAVIDKEVISYSLRDRMLTFRRRGLNGTKAVAHSNNTKVFFVSKVIELNSGSLVQPIESVSYKSTEDWHYSTVEVNYGDKTATAKNDSVSTENSLTIETLLDSHQLAIAQRVADDLLSEFGRQRNVVNLILHFDEDLFAGDTIYLSVPGRSHLEKAVQILEVNHSISLNFQETEIRAITV